MIKTLHHRGPDDQGMLLRKWETSFVGLGHKRLSIIDITSSGHQPQSYQDLDIVFNGEVYNFLEIRTLLEELGYDFTTKSDTEVVLKSFHCWGIDCLEKFVGMFAFCIIDNKNQIVYLCRDRIGVKPLFFYEKNDIILFASELKAFHEVDGFDGELYKPAVRSFLQYGYIPAPSSIFRNTYKLRQGHYAIIDTKTKNVVTKSYWKPEDYFKHQIKISYKEALQESERLLIKACKYRMVADVPVGVFLSGGYDSTLVTALLKYHGYDSLKTFTIGFPDGIDESKDAARIAKHIGTQHTILECTFQQAKEVIPDLPYYYDEPLGDISCIPSIIVSRLAAKEVKVALSADGGDELFAGYNGYSNTLQRLKFMNSIPKDLRPILGIVSKAISSCATTPVSIKHKLKGWQEYYSSNQNIFEFILNSSKIPDEYLDKIMITNDDSYTFFTNLNNLDDWGNNILLSHYETNLPDYLLVKMDRASMSASLEAREPLLDHRLVEFAAGLPFQFKNNGHKSKIIIRDIVHKYVPQNLMDRPKTGFDLPIFDWLKGDLRPLVDEYLSNEKICQSGLFCLKNVKKIKTDFLNDKLKYKTIIWHLIIFQMWMEKWYFKD